MHFDLVLVQHILAVVLASKLTLAARDNDLTLGTRTS